MNKLLLLAIVFVQATFNFASGSNPYKNNIRNKSNVSSTAFGKRAVHVPTISSHKNNHSLDNNPRYLTPIVNQKTDTPSPARNSQPLLIPAAKNSQTNHSSHHSHQSGKSNYNNNTALKYMMASVVMSQQKDSSQKKSSANYSNSENFHETLDELMQEERSIAMQRAKKNNCDTFSYSLEIQTGSLISYIDATEFVPEIIVSKKGLAKTLSLKEELRKKIHKEAEFYDHEEEHAKALNILEAVIQDEITTIKNQIESINRSIEQCKEFKKNIRSCIEKEQNKYFFNTILSDEDTQDLTEFLTYIFLLMSYHELFHAITSESIQAAQEKIDLALALLEKISNTEYKKENQNNNNSNHHEKDLESFVSFFEQIDCQQFIENNSLQPRRIIATSAILTQQYLDAGGNPVLGTIGAAFVIGTFAYENRQAIFDFITQANKYKNILTPQEKIALEQVEKYSQDMNRAIDTAVNNRYAGSIKKDNILDTCLYDNVVYEGDCKTQVLVILEKDGSQRIYVIKGGNLSTMQELPQAFYESLQYKLFTPQHVKTKLAELADREQAKKNAALEQKNLDTHAALKKIEKNLPKPSKYDQLPDYQNLLPVQGSGIIFEPALSKDGKPLRNNKGYYYDTQGREWIFDKKNNVWIVQSYDNKTIYTVQIKDQNPPQPPKDTPPSSTPTSSNFPSNSNNNSPDLSIDSIEPENPSTTPMDAAPPTRPVSTGCGGDKQYLHKPLILVHPAPEEKKRHDTAHGPLEKLQRQLPGCGHAETIENPSPGCGQKPEVKIEDFILKNSADNTWTDKNGITWPLGDLSGQDIIFNEANKNHIFDERKGHLIDTPENRNRLLQLVKNPKNYLLESDWGNWWYAEILFDGTQLWAEVRGYKIINCGLNEAPLECHPGTGLSRPQAPKKVNNLNKDLTCKKK